MHKRITFPIITTNWLKRC